MVLSTHGARLTGTVKETDGGRVYPKVVLIPIPGNLNTDPAWRFLIQDDSWEDPDLLREIDGRGVALRFEEGAAESVESQ